MNVQRGLLPHGWLEYTTPDAGRAYYYNVHTKVATWTKPENSNSNSNPDPRPSMCT